MPHVCLIAGLCAWTEGTSVQLGAFQENMAEVATPGILFYLLCFLNRNINQFSNAGPDSPSSRGKAKE